MDVAAAIMERDPRLRRNGAACHAQMYTMGTLLRYGSDAAEGKSVSATDRARRIAASGVRRHRADVGHRHAVVAHDRRSPRRKAIFVTGQKIWISRAQHSDLMLLLARTTPRDQVQRSARKACRSFSSTCGKPPTKGLSIRPIRTMMNHATT